MGDKDAERTKREIARQNNAHGLWRPPLSLKGRQGLSIAKRKVKVTIAGKVSP